MIRFIQIEIMTSPILKDAREKWQINQIKLQLISFFISHYLWIYFSQKYGHEILTNLPPWPLSKFFFIEKYGLSKPYLPMIWHMSEFSQFFFLDFLPKWWNLKIQDLLWKKKGQLYKQYMNIIFFKLNDIPFRVF